MIIIHFVHYSTCLKEHVYNRFCTFPIISMETRVKQNKYNFRSTNACQEWHGQSISVLCETSQYGQVPYEIFTVGEVSIWKHVIWKFVLIATCEQEDVWYETCTGLRVSIWTRLRREFIHFTTCLNGYVSDWKMFGIACMNIHTCVWCNFVQLSNCADTCHKKNPYRTQLL